MKFESEFSKSDRILWQLPILDCFSQRFLHGSGKAVWVSFTVGIGLRIGQILKLLFPQRVQALVKHMKDEVVRLNELWKGNMLSQFIEIQFLLNKVLVEIVIT